MDKFLILVHSLAQAEITRSYGCQQLITDYYTYMSQGDVAEVQENFKADLALDTTIPLEDEAQGTFPRLEKLYDSAVRQFTGEEEVDDKTKS